MADYYSGRVLSVVFENPGTVFYVLKMVLDSGKQTPVTVKGIVPGVKMTEGVWFGFEGSWSDHREYGRQLVISRAPVLKGGWDVETASKTLVAHGVGSQVVQAIREHVGDAGFLDALTDAARLADVPGMSTFSAMHVVARWEAVRAQFESLEILSSLGLPKSRVRDIWLHFRDETQHVLTTNPWALVEVDGITFAQANEVAVRSGLSNPGLQARGAVLYTCKAHRAFGHMFLRPNLLVGQVQDTISDISSDRILEALATLHKEGLLVIDREARPGTTAIYEPWAYETEVQSAQGLARRQMAAQYVPGAERTLAYMRALGSVGPRTAAAVTPTASVSDVVQVAIEEWGAQAHLVLSDAQKQGILHALTAPVSILSGLPGTGKTTSLQAAVRILQDAQVPFLLCAPTGIAAKNLTARTGAPASTIHRAFAARVQAETRRGANYTGIVGDTMAVLGAPGAGEGDWGYGPDKPHPAEVIIIDEASMVDQYLLFRLLNCTLPEARLVFVGDHAQLPSVGPGNVLRDLIRSELFPTTKLTQIFRQEDTSGIVYAAHSIHQGDVPELNKDFRLMVLPTEDAVLDAVLKIGKRFFDERRNFQILSPKHNGIVGVTNLNARLRELLNAASPGCPEIRLGADTIREGDRVMVIQNDYKLGVFNGDVGKVAKVDKPHNSVMLKVYGEPPLYVKIDFKEVPRLLRLAYACTVHKAQGLEYDHIVMPLVSGFHHQLQRNLLYTAITRAKKQVFLLGQKEALVAAVLNAKEDDRATLFRDRLWGAWPIPSGVGEASRGLDP
jgi:exodeoxyribonuclease V alpha subunit